MKVEMINKNKVIITVTYEELAKRKITLKDITEGSQVVQDFFFEVLEETDIVEDFAYESSGLFVEISTFKDNIFIITITKADCLPDTSTLDNLPTKKTSYTVSSNIYSFSSLNELYKFCKKALEENLYVGVNSLYEFNNKYFLLFSNSTIKKSDFIRTFSLISEYSENYFSKQTVAFLEYAKQILSKSAIQTLQKF